MQRYDEAIEVLKIMLLKLDDAPDAQIRTLHQQYASPSEVQEIIRRVIDARLESAPLRLIDTSTGRLCNREVQINAFMDSTDFVFIGDEPACSFEEAVTKYFSRAMLSHSWESKELLLQDVQDKVVYDLDPVGTAAKLQNCS
ncbi:hypothetical protein DFH29DRAFT_146281 [Suillus ampliporus]|nr:hypothetical protein DFH29DRAFT_146281 [Suillus ampliporus]